MRFFNFLAEAAVEDVETTAVTEAVDELAGERQLLWSYMISEFVTDAQANEANSQVAQQAKRTKQQATYHKILSHSHVTMASLGLVKSVGIQRSATQQSAASRTRLTTQEQRWEAMMYSSSSTVGSHTVASVHISLMQAITNEYRNLQQMSAHSTQAELQVAKGVLKGLEAIGKGIDAISNSAQDVLLDPAGALVAAAPTAKKALQKTEAFALNPKATVSAASHQAEQFAKLTYMEALAWTQTPWQTQAQQFGTMIPFGVASALTDGAAGIAADGLSATLDDVAMSARLAKVRLFQAKESKLTTGHYYHLTAKEVRFTQPNAGPYFKNGARIDDLVARLKSGEVSPGDLPPIQVVQKDGKYFSIDNRRLVAFNAAGIEHVPTEVVSLGDPVISSKFQDRFFPIDGEGLYVIVVPRSEREDALNILEECGKIRRKVYEY